MFLEMLAYVRIREMEWWQRRGLNCSLEDGIMMGSEDGDDAVGDEIDSYRDDTQVST